MHANTTNQTQTVVMAFAFSFRLLLSLMHRNCSRKYTKSQAFPMLSIYHDETSSLHS